MSQFMGEVWVTEEDGLVRTKVSRQGRTSEIVHAHIHGWDMGIRIKLYHGNGKDIAHVYVTRGSHTKHTEEVKYIFSYTSDQDMPDVATAIVVNPAHERRDIRAVGKYADVPHVSMPVDPELL